MACVLSVSACTSGVTPPPRPEPPPPVDAPKLDDYLSDAPPGWELDDGAVLLSPATAKAIEQQLLAGRALEQEALLAIADQQARDLNHLDHVRAVDQAHFELLLQEERLYSWEWWEVVLLSSGVAVVAGFIGAVVGFVVGEESTVVLQQ